MTSDGRLIIPKLTMKVLEEREPKTHRHHLEVTISPTETQMKRLFGLKGIFRFS